jgi:hypothetical protein
LCSVHEQQNPAGVILPGFVFWGVVMFQGIDNPWNGPSTVIGQAQLPSILGNPQNGDAVTFHNEGNTDLSLKTHDT